MSRLPFLSRNIEGGDGAPGGGGATACALGHGEAHSSLSLSRSLSPGQRQPLSGAGLSGEVDDAGPILIVAEAAVLLRRRGWSTAGTAHH
eukprot:COSAG01_NODE_6280_length_3755_cov_33.946663_5_plen_90_part_00